jgi:hypothetical protein
MVLEHFHTPGSLGNSLSWGDQPIPEPVDEVVDVQAITYDRKIQLIVKRTGKKRRITLDSVVMITMEETLLDAGQSRVSELLGESMAISSATIDREREDEREVDSMREELVHLKHQVEYYQDTTQAVRFMRIEFGEIYTQFKSDREVFMTKIVSYQEETLLGLVAYKEMMRWSEKYHQVLAQIEYIREIQKGRGEEEHGIRMLADESLVRIRIATKYWVQLVIEPQIENAGKMGGVSQELEQHKPENDRPSIPRIWCSWWLRRFAHYSPMVQRARCIIWSEYSGDWMLEKGQVKRLVDRPIGAVWALRQLSLR